jgi:hypothetical protein
LVSSDALIRLNNGLQPNTTKNQSSKMLPVLSIIEEAVVPNSEIGKISSSTKLPYLSRATTIKSKDLKPQPGPSKFVVTEKSFKEMS